MPDKTAELAGVIADAMKHSSEKKTEPYDTTAVVTRIEKKEDGTKQTWVSIPGGVRETPVRTGVAMKPGDEVHVHVGGGRAIAQGNYTSPPTDDTRANQAYSVGVDAMIAAERADLYAQEAQESADKAHEAADEADRWARDAWTKAGEASDWATSAWNSASSALTGLSIVEDVVNVINWVVKPENVSTDMSVVQGKTYYVYDPNTGKISEAVPQAGDNPSALGWYELDEAIANYVSHHLALTDDGLTLISDNNSTRTVITNGRYLVVANPTVSDISSYYEIVNGQYVKTSDTAIAQGKTYYAATQKPGMYIWNANQQIAYYGDGAMIGTRGGFNIRITGTELGFYDGKSGDPDAPVAYLNNNTLYITQSVVVNEMQVGERNSRPEWTWKYDKSDRSLYLKWIGV